MKTNHNRLKKSFPKLNVKNANDEDTKHEPFFSYHKSQQFNAEMKKARKRRRKYCLAVMIHTLNYLYLHYLLLYYNSIAYILSQAIHRV